MLVTRGRPCGKMGAVMNRPELMDRLRSQDGPRDLLIIGGGATGVGCAVDAASRGYQVALIEQSDDLLIHDIDLLSNV